MGTSETLGLLRNKTCYHCKEDHIDVIDIAKIDIFHMPNARAGTDDF